MCSSDRQLRQRRDSRQVSKSRPASLVAPLRGREWRPLGGACRFGVRPLLWPIFPIRGCSLSRDAGGRSQIGARKRPVSARERPEAVIGTCGSHTGYFVIYLPKLVS